LPLIKRIRGSVPPWPKFAINFAGTYRRFETIPPIQRTEAMLTGKYNRIGLAEKPVHFNFVV
jgi:hypothetical protein